MSLALIYTGIVVFIIFGVLFIHRSTQSLAVELDELETAVNLSTTVTELDVLHTKLIDIHNRCHDKSTWHRIYLIDIKIQAKRNKIMNNHIL